MIKKIIILTSFFLISCKQDSSKLNDVNSNNEVKKNEKVDPNLFGYWKLTKNDMWSTNTPKPIIMHHHIDPNERYFYFIDNKFIKKCYVKNDKNISKNLSYKITWIDSNNFNYLDNDTLFHNKINENISLNKKKYLKIENKYGFNGKNNILENNERTDSEEKEFNNYFHTLMYLESIDEVLDKDFLKIAKEKCNM
ncbi:MAG: hypothetical protein K2X69_17830 [Silvanigrellaceae bacterium]|jgi:hypothetical protein|nr:hypothetical protein [Silvanigrellaceae bacterium]